MWRVAVCLRRDALAVATKTANAVSVKPLVHAVASSKREKRDVAFVQAAAQKNSNNRLREFPLHCRTLMRFSSTSVKCEESHELKYIQKIRRLHHHSPGCSYLPHGRRHLSPQQVL